MRVGRWLDGQACFQVGRRGRRGFVGRFRRDRGARKNRLVHWGHGRHGRPLARAVGCAVAHLAMDDVLCLMSAPFWVRPAGGLASHNETRWKKI